eukprot:gene6331-7878_t
MKLADYLNLDDVMYDLEVSSKTQALRAMADVVSRDAGVPAAALLAALQKRERLGSTGIGQGVAIPHTRMEGVDKPRACLARLKRAVEFDAIDDLPVDVILMLITPDVEANRHLNVLAHFTRKLRFPGVLEGMRAAADARTLCAHLTDKA